MIRDTEVAERIFQNGISATVGHEGGFSNHENDSGGATRYGITEATARRWGYAGDMRQLPFSTAVLIYRDYYWRALALDRICLLSAPIALEVFDTGVNCGTGVAGEFLQRCLNVFNQGQKDYPDLKVDGKPGPVTVLALTKFLSLRGATGEAVMLKALNALQGEYYIVITEKRELSEDFVYGWIRARIFI